MMTWLIKENTHIQQTLQTYFWVRRTKLFYIIISNSKLELIVYMNYLFNKIAVSSWSTIAQQIQE
jgi:hypothetical protein